MGIEPESRDKTDREARLRRSYELGQVGIAVVATLPLVLLAGLSVVVSGGHRATTVVGLLAVALGGILAWSSREQRRAIPPGTFAGLIPLLAGFVAHFLGETWLERPAWLFGLFFIGAGALASWSLGRVMKARTRGTDLLTPASALTVAVGSMGCVAVGGEELLAMLVGFFAASQGSRDPKS